MKLKKKLNKKKKEENWLIINEIYFLRDCWVFLRKVFEKIA